jgi:hypothetical protein
VLDKVWAEDRLAHKVHLLWLVEFISYFENLEELIMALCLVARFGFVRCFKKAHDFMLDLFGLLGFLGFLGFTNPILCPGLIYGFD